jgi:hypothetical protein
MRSPALLCRVVRLDISRRTYREEPHLLLVSRDARVLVELVAGQLILKTALG